MVAVPQPLTRILPWRVPFLIKIHEFHASPVRYETMKYARCGRSGLMLPRISLGLWHNFGNIDRYAWVATWCCALSTLGSPISIWQTTTARRPARPRTTSDGCSREDLASYRDEIIISTKAGYLMWSGPYGEWGSREEPARQPRSEPQAHAGWITLTYSIPTGLIPSTPIEETMGALEQAVRSGKGLYAGISNYQPADARKAAALLRHSAHHA